ncbi:MAG: chloride channel protein, partial [Gammaproteobacteria bacterium]
MIPRPGDAAAAVAGIAAAALLGGVSAFLSILFFEGGGAVHQWLGIAPDENGARNPWILVLAPAVAGIICAVIKNYTGVFYGLADTMLTAQRGETQPRRAAVLSVAASFAAFGGGASVGQYGPVGHLGGLVGGWFGRFWERGVGPACGVAAAIAAAFNAPVTGLLFAHEVILRRYSANIAAPVAISAIVGWAVSVNVFNRPAFLSIGEMRSVTPPDILLFGGLGIIFGVLSALYLRAIFALLKILAPRPALPLLAGAGAVCGMLWLLAPEAAGGGRELLRAAVENDITASSAAAAGIVKVAATILCLGAGFAGGIVSPTLVIGAMAGAVCASFAAAAGIYDGPAFVPVICGMMAFTAPAIGAPLTGILFVLELSGGNYPLTIAASLSVA